MSDSHPEPRRPHRYEREAYAWWIADKTIVRYHMLIPMLYDKWDPDTKDYTGGEFWVCPVIIDYCTDRRCSFPAGLDEHREKRALELCNTYAGVKSTAWEIIVDQEFDGVDPINWETEDE